MMIAGFERPTSGTITLAGRPIDPVPPHRRNIGMVFQNYALFPNMSVARNVGYPLRMRGVPKTQIRDKVAAMLRIVGLSAFADAEPRNLSGGQQQRVALARALVFDPDVLLLDEPLGALDKNLREQMQIEIRRIHRELGVTTVYVTHDQTEAMTMSDRIAVFNAGRIEQVATPLEIYGRPQTAFVAGFIGDNNIFPATGSGCRLRGGRPGSRQGFRCIAARRRASYFSSSGIDPAGEIARRRAEHLCSRRHEPVELWRQRRRVRQSGHARPEDALVRRRCCRRR